MIATHTAIAGAHHAKTGNDEVYGLFRVGLDAGKPAPGIVGRFYWATDTKILYYDTGVAWVETTRGETVTRLAQLAERAHGSLTGVTPDQHHAQDHAASHEPGGADEVNLAGLDGEPSDTINKSILTAQGDIITRDATAPKRLAKGITGYYLKAGANEPEWTAVPPGYTDAEALAWALVVGG
ncbi:unnamed protein product [marine sediment metagenome]|uniref:Uncharacterized protein n=1 Tax=marine sediment metagenome TaxID=412755 RepID=X1HKC0_9ZZZZ